MLDLNVFWGFCGALCKIKLNPTYSDAVIYPDELREFNMQPIYFRKNGYLRRNKKAEVVV